MNATQAAITLEQILSNPTSRAALRALGDTIPTHRRDQINAADRDTGEIMHTIGAILGNHTEAWHDIADFPDWLRLEILSRITAFLANTADTCRHSPHPGQPIPIFAAACKPNLITCNQCTHLLGMRLGSDADRTCDACGHICAGLDAGEGIYPGVSRYGLLVFTYGTCASCRPNCIETPT